MFNHFSVLRNGSHIIREAHPSYSEDGQAKQTNKQMSNLLAFIDFSCVSCALTLILFAIPPVKVCRIACSIISSCLSARLSHPSFCGQNTNKHKYVSDSFMPLMIRILTLMPPPHNSCIEKLFVQFVKMCLYFIDIHTFSCKQSWNLGKFCKSTLRIGNTVNGLIFWSRNILQCKAYLKQNKFEISSIFLLVVKSWNWQHHGQTIHPTENLISMNLFKILCVATWAWLFDLHGHGGC